jgi:hypothetical protein
MNIKQFQTAWAMQADLTTLIGGQEWADRRWTSATLAFYNRRAFATWLANQVAA